MAERGRAPGFVMSQEHRDKIKNSNILSRLITHVESDAGILSQSQVACGLGLLKKIMPDVSAVSVDGDGQGGAIILRIEATDADL